MIKNYLASCAILALALTAFNAKAHANQSSDACPAPGIQTSSNVAAEAVTKKNYAKAETVDILNDYVKRKYLRIHAAMVLGYLCTIKKP